MSNRNVHLHALQTSLDTSLDTHSASLDAALDTHTSDGSVDASLDTHTSVWVPSERLSLHLLPKPTAPRRKWRELLPWLLEERLLEPVENMHLVMAGEVGDSLCVLAVSKEDMRQWLQTVEAAGLAPSALQPDFLALPWAEGEISVAQRQNAAGQALLLVRHGPVQGFAAPKPVARLMLTKLLAAEPDSHLSLFMAPEALPEALLERARVKGTAPEWETSQPIQLNLLSGEFRPVHKHSPWRQWWPTAALLVLTLSMAYSWLSLENRQLALQVAQLEQQQQRYVRTLFPGTLLNTSAATMDTHTRQMQILDTHTGTTSLDTHSATMDATMDTHIRETLDTHISDRFVQHEQLQAPVISFLMKLDDRVEQCDCQVESFDFAESGGELTVSGTADMSDFTLPGFSVKKTSPADTEPLQLSFNREQP